MAAVPARAAACRADAQEDFIGRGPPTVERVEHVGFRVEGRVAAERRGRALAELAEEFGAAHRRMTEVLGRLPEEVDESTPAYKFTEAVTFRHFAHHAAQIEEWKRKMMSAK